MGRLRRHGWRLGAAGAVLALLAMLTTDVLRPRAAAIPFPNPIVIVTTQSGSVVRQTPVPVGGLPVPIDVDDGGLAGLLLPDIDVSIPLVELRELNNGLTKIVQPQIVVRRNALAPIRGAPAPPLKLDALIEVKDLSGGPNVATINYGFETPGGTRVPPLVHARLTSPVETGFVDPIEGVIEAPGYNGPLDFNVRARTPAMDARFDIDFDPLPRRFHFVAKPGKEGLDFHYDHNGDIPDVKLDAAVKLADLAGGNRLDVTAAVERLPRSLDLAFLGHGGRTTIDYASQTSLRKPDVGATFRLTKADGSLIDAAADVSGLPAKMAALLEESAPGKLSKVDFRVLDGQKIDAVEFLARNWLGAPGTVPELHLGPDQWVAVATRRTGPQASRFRAAGRIEDIRSATFTNAGGVVDARTDIGDGKRPLRTVLDFDDRGPGAAAKAARLFVDATVAPLPRTIHGRYEEATGSRPLRVLYEAEQSVDVDARLSQDVADGEQLALDAHVDRLPRTLDVTYAERGGDLELDYLGIGDGPKPDIASHVRHVAPGGTLNVDADVDVTGLPRRMHALLRKDATDALEHVDFDVLEGGKIDALAFLARNYLGDPGPVPEPVVDDDQYAAVATRRMPDGSSRFRAAGRIRDIRAASFTKTANDPGDPKDDAIDADIDVGDGVRPLRAILDFDGRGPGADADAARLQADTTITPLPSLIAVHFQPQKGSDPLAVVYNANKRVDVDATFSRTAADGADLSVGAHVRRLPPSLTVKYADLADAKRKEFSFGSTPDAAVAKPDIDATVRDVAGDGTVNVDADLAITGLPAKMTGVLDTSGPPDEDGEDTLAAVEFGVPDGGEVDALEFLARNWLGNAGPLPEPPVDEDQFVAVATRPMPDGRSRFRAAGRITRLRSARYEKLVNDPDTPKDDGLDARVDVGNGTTPLHALADFDDRVPGDCSGDDDGDGKGGHLELDATITPLPRDIHARYEASTGDAPLKITYESPQSVDVDAAFSRRGVCEDLLEADARVKRLPRRLDITYTDTDELMDVVFGSETDAPKPDVAARIRSVAGDGTVNLDADIDARGLPRALTAHLDTTPLASDDPCNADGEGEALDGVTFTVPDDASTPAREELDSVAFLARNWLGDPGSLPEVELTGDQRIAVATRRVDQCHSRFRATGRLEHLRSATYENIEKDPATDEDDGIDARVDVGDGAKPLRAVVDFDSRGPGAPEKAARMKLDTTVTPLPKDIHARYEPSAGGEPLKVLYESGDQADVDADVYLAAGDADGCGEAGVVCAEATVDRLPPRILLDLPGEGVDDLLVSHTGSETDGPDVSAKVDLRPEDDPETEDEHEDVRSYVEAALVGVPREIRGRLSLSSDVQLAAEFHACTWSFTSSTCSDDQGKIRSVTFTKRDRPDRRGLPPAFAPGTDPFVGVVARGDLKEITGRVEEVRNVAFQQRKIDDDEDGKPDDVDGDGKTKDELGTLGAHVDAGAGERLDVKIDQRDGDGAARVDINVHDLPSDFTACVRDQNDKAPPDPDDLPDLGLLEACDRTDVLGYEEGDLESTPLSLVYHASAATRVEADVRTETPDTNPDPKVDCSAVQRFTADVQKVPQGTTRADVIPPISPKDRCDRHPDGESRKLELEYQADHAIDEIAFAMDSRRADSFCADPRRNRKATCLSATIKNLPSKISASYDPDPAAGDIDFKAPAGSDASRLSIDPIQLSAVDDKPADEPDGPPILLRAKVTKLSDHLHAKVQELDLTGEDPEGAAAADPPKSLADRLATCSDETDNDGTDGTDSEDPDCKPELAQIAFDACPDAGVCSGIEKIEFAAATTLQDVNDDTDDDLIPAPPGAASTATQKLSYVQRGAHFRAAGTIARLREVRYSHVDEAGKPMDTTLLRAELGGAQAGESISAYVDADDGQSATTLDTVVEDAPSAIDLCLRPEVAKATDSSTIWCERQAADRTAIQASNTGTGAPDIDVRKLELSQGGGANMLRGTATVKDLAKRIDVLTGDDGTLEIEGQDDADAEPENVAGRITADIRNFASVPERFPWIPSSGRVDPDKDDRNKDSADNTRNYVKLMTQSEGDIDRFRAQASVPALKRVRMRPAACASDDPRFPARAAFAESHRPTYQCINVIAAQSRPLGVAMRDDKPYSEAVANANPGTSTVLALEEGHVTSVPAGDAGLSITQTTAPAALKLAPTCSTVDMTDRNLAEHPCQPPMIDVHAPKAAGQQSRLQASIATGDDVDLGRLRVHNPADALSNRLDYERHPTKYGALGIRVKVGTPKGREPAIRIGAFVDIPEYLTLDPPVIFSCSHKTLTVDLQTDADHNGTADDCESKDVDTDRDARNNVTKGVGYKTGDIAFKVVGSAKRPDQSTRDDYVDSLGRVAVFVDPMSTEKEDAEIVLTGTPPADGKTPLRSRSIQGASGGGVERSVRHAAHTVDSDGFEQVGACSSPQTCEAHESLLSDLGFSAPGFLDARIYLRDDLNYKPGNTAADPRQFQQKYTQVDGRVSDPLSLAVRVNTINDPDGGHNRDGDEVATTNLNARNLPGLGAQTAFDLGKPTFRIRAELSNRNPFPPKRCGWPQYTEGVPAVVGCATLPVRPVLEWLDVNVNAEPNPDDPSDPNDTFDAPARTVDVVGRLFGDTNDVDLRGFKEVDGKDGVHGKGEAAIFTPQAGLRMTDVDVGLINAINTEHVIIDGDVVLGVAGNVNHLRLSHSGAQLGLRAEPSTSDATAGYVETDFRGEVHYKRVSIFGVTEADLVVPRQAVNLRLKDCRGTFGQDLGSASDINEWNTRLSDFEVEPAPRTDAGLDHEKIWGSIAFISGAAGGLPQTGEQARAANFLADATTLVNPILCGQKPFHHDDDLNIDKPQASFNDLVTSQHPAPAYALAQRPINGDVEADEGDAPTLPESPGTTAKLEITTDTTLCGQVVTDELTVKAGKTVTIGGSGADSRGLACNGTLDIAARKVVLEPGARITATGKADKFRFDDPLTPHVNEEDVNGPGSPISGSFDGESRGAAHHGKGGGDIGDPYPVPAAGPLADLGSRGGEGDELAGGDGVQKAPGGQGGGAIRISAETIDLQDDATHDPATIEANGARGADSGAASCSVARVGAGGGSGGHVALNAVQILGSGRIQARGGDGGGGGNGGGGGGGGRISGYAGINTAATDVSGGKGGSGFIPSGDTESHCPTFGEGEGGDDSALTPERAATVTLPAENPGPLTKSTAVKVEVIGTQRGTLLPNGERTGADGPMQIVVCVQSLPADTTVSDPLQSTDLDAPATGELYGIARNLNCRATSFTEPNEPGGIYRRKLTFEGLQRLPDGYHGFFAMAAQYTGFGGLSTECTDQLNDQNCTFQPHRPQTSARLAVDTTAPAVQGTPTLLNGAQGCHGSTPCLSDGTGRFRFAASDQLSGIDDVECFLEKGASSFATKACTAGRDEAIEIPAGDGTWTVKAKVTDVAGNVGTISIGSWFVDRRVPERPTMAVDAGGTATNGWYRQKPTVTVTAVDKGPSGGFRADGITFFADTATNRCGDEHAFDDGLDSTVVTTTCAIPDSFVPDDGIHELSAEVEDALGNRSARVDTDHTRAGAQSYTMRVDTTVPKSRLFLASDDPPDDGTYRTRPTFAFTAIDEAGGSGVDPGTSPSGVKFKVIPAGDSAPTSTAGFASWDPDAATNRIPDGERKVCWSATDVAGNTAAVTCSATIKVDSLPTSQLVLDPPQGDGPGGLHRDRPYFAFAARTADGPWVDFTKPGPHVRFKVFASSAPEALIDQLDGYDTWDPAAEESNRVPTGSRIVCWFAEEGTVEEGRRREAKRCSDPIGVDPGQPLSELVVDPAAPDGGGAYVAPPAFRFRAVDPAGEPVDFTKVGRQVRYRVFPSLLASIGVSTSTYSTWEPSSFDANRLREPTNVVCWLAIVDGNQELPQKCSAPIGVEPGPVSALVLDAPAAPDGAGGWFREQPHFRFAASYAGEPVDFSKPGPEVSYRVVDSSVTTPPSTGYAPWDPAAFASNRVPDGTKKVCWLAKVGGDVELPRCSDELKVDATAPVLVEALDPAAPDGDHNFYVAPPRLTVDGVDGGSGVEHVTYRLDGGPWVAVPAAGATIPRGRHVVETRLLDRAGNRSMPSTRRVMVDDVKPVLSAGTFPPAPNDQGWFRQPTRVALDTLDGRDGSAPTATRYRIDGAGSIGYTTPFIVDEGDHGLEVTGTDGAGNASDALQRPVRVDLQPPVARPTGNTPSLVGILTGGSTTLAWHVTDALADRVKVRIQIYDTLGNVIRELPITGPLPGGYSPEGDGKVTWNGRDANGLPALAGTYFYRVQATDQAGNTVLSTESPTFVVVAAGLNPLLRITVKVGL